jgi:hypothetical protein
MARLPQLCPPKSPVRVDQGNGSRPYTSAHTSADGSAASEVLCRGRSTAAIFLPRVAISRQTFRPVGASVPSSSRPRVRVEPAQTTFAAPHARLTWLWRKKSRSALQRAHPLRRCVSTRCRVAASGEAPSGKDVWVLWDGGIRAAPRVSRPRGFASGRVGGPVPPSIHAFGKSRYRYSRSLPQPSPHRRGTTSWRFACAFIPR